MVKQKTQRQRKVLLDAYGSYLTHKGKALNPNDIKIVFLDEESPIGETTESFLKVMTTVREVLGKKSLAEKLFKL